MSELLGRPASASLGPIGPPRPSIPLEGFWETVQKTLREDEPILVSDWEGSESMTERGSGLASAGLVLS
jgi:hypothetical protein